VSGYLIKDKDMGGGTVFEKNENPAKNPNTCWMLSVSTLDYGKNNKKIRLFKLPL
jgi:hypothetical protein